MIKRLVLIISLCLPLMASAAGGGHLYEFKPDLGNEKSLQQGARVFINYCMGCHSADYMRYNRIGEDLNIADEALNANFMFGTDKSGNTMGVSMRKQDGEAFFGVTPPDLSVIARSRGAKWLYTYFMTFYIDESRPFGVNNLVFKDVGMPHVLWELQGWQKPVYETVTDEDGHDHKVIKTLELVKPGRQSPEEYQQTVTDLVNFLVYLGEPAQLQRKKIGLWVLLYLALILLPVTYLLKKDYWKDIH